MHLAIDACELACCIQSHRRVVIKPRRAAFEERSNNGDAQLRAQLPPAAPSTALESPPPNQTAVYLRAGRNTAFGKAPAGRRSVRPAAPPRECDALPPQNSPPDRRPSASAPALHGICESQSCPAGQPFPFHCHLPVMQRGQPRQSGLASVILSCPLAMRLGSVPLQQSSWSICHACRPPPIA